MDVKTIKISKSAHDLVKKICWGKTLKMTIQSWIETAIFEKAETEKVVPEKKPLRRAHTGR